MLQKGHLIGIRVIQHTEKRKGDKACQQVGTLQLITVHETHLTVLKKNGYHQLFRWGEIIQVALLFKHDCGDWFMVMCYLIHEIDWEIWTSETRLEQQRPKSFDHAVECNMIYQKPKLKIAITQDKYRLNVSKKHNLGIRDANSLGYERKLNCLTAHKWMMKEDVDSWTYVVDLPSDPKIASLCLYPIFAGMEMLETLTWLLQRINMKTTKEEEIPWADPWFRKSID